VCTLYGCGVQTKIYTDQIEFDIYYLHIIYNKTEVCEAVKHTIGLDEFDFRSICFCQIFQTIEFEVVKSDARPSLYNYAVTIISLA